MDKYSIQYDTYIRKPTGKKWVSTQKWYPTLLETLWFINETLVNRPQKTVMRLICGVAAPDGSTVEANEDFIYFFLSETGTLVHTSKEFLPRNDNDIKKKKEDNKMKIGENEVLEDLGTMTDGAEYHLYLVKSPMGVRKVAYVCDGEGHCWPDDALVSAESVKKAFPNPSEAAKAEAVLKETFRQLWESDNGLSTNVPCCDGQYPDGVDADFVESVYDAFDLIEDVIVCGGREEGDNSIEALEDDTILFDYLLRFDMRGRDDWFN